MGQPGCAFAAVAEFGSGLDHLQRGGRRTDRVGYGGPRLSRDSVDAHDDRGELSVRG
jgi:hypothetical protein